MNLERVLIKRVQLAEQNMAKSVEMVCDEVGREWVEAIASNSDSMKHIC